MPRGPRTSSGRTVTIASVVVDASVLIRAGVEREPQARIWTDAVETGRARGHVPELAYAEVASALTQSVRAGTVKPQDAREILVGLVALPLRSHRQAALAAASLTIALEEGLSTYDASYVALARSLEATLVTADRRLAEAVSGSELLP
jgi:predicted nucleic acid-binding protein